MTSIFGGAGADRLFGGAGDDTLYIDASDTVVDGGEGSDSVYVQGAAGVTLDLAVSAIERAIGGVGADKFDAVASSAAEWSPMAGPATIRFPGPVSTTTCAAMPATT